MSTVAQEIESGAVQAIAAAITANASVEEGFITTAEAAIDAGIVNVFKNLPAVKGIAGLVAGPVESAVDTALTSYVNGLFAKYTPAQIVTAVAAIVAKL